MRILVVIAVAVAIGALVSGCATQVYYSPYPDYSPPGPELYRDSPPGPELYRDSPPGPELYRDSPPGPELYGGPYPYGPYAYGYYGGPYWNGHPGYWASSSSVCWDSGRRIPCPGNAP